jgi:hypothetical protein
LAVLGRFFILHVFKFVFALFVNQVVTLLHHLVEDFVGAFNGFGPVGHTFSGHLYLLVSVGEEQLAGIEQLNYVRDCEDALLVKPGLRRAKKEFAVVYYVVRNLLDVF